MIKIEHPDPSKVPLSLKETHLDREEWQRSNLEYYANAVAKSQS
jgi:hypothetical protein